MGLYEIIDFLKEHKNSWFSAKQIINTISNQPTVGNKSNIISKLKKLRNYEWVDYRTTVITLKGYKRHVFQYRYKE